ncbi:MAG TPA: ankyrin repeat domain-containing protein [Thermoanaerobaculia bacterium]|nr:ankyrin repeat domain-containing protein [Thermoanaerobaculia bacterium]
MRAAFALAALATLVLLDAGCRAPRLADYDRAEALALLAERGIPFTEDGFLDSLRHHDLAPAAAFLAAGMDPDTLDGRALATAAAGGRIDLVRLLLEAGADPDRPSGSFGQPPLVSAVLRGHTGIVEALLDAGADPDAPARGGTAALQFAKDAAMARRLLEAGARPDVRDPAGSTPLMGAVLLGDLAQVDTLLEHGADAGAVDHEGRTALLLASILGFSAIEQRLIAAGAPPPRRPAVEQERLEAYAGRYGEPGRVGLVLLDRGRLFLIEAGSRGLLFENELIPLTDTDFYRAGDPGAVVFRFELEDGRVVGLSRPQWSVRTTAPRIVE